MLRRPWRERQRTDYPTLHSVVTLRTLDAGSYPKGKEPEYLIRSFLANIVGSIRVSPESPCFAREGAHCHSHTERLQARQPRRQFWRHVSSARLALLAHPTDPAHLPRQQATRRRVCLRPTRHRPLHPPDGGELTRSTLEARRSLTPPATAEHARPLFGRYAHASRRSALRICLTGLVVVLTPLSLIHYMISPFARGRSAALHGERSSAAGEG